MDDKGGIHYVYDAAGNKLQKKTTDIVANTNKVTTYIGSEVFETTYPINGTQPTDTLQFFGTSEGRARINAAKNAFVYDYFLKDHLGNTRMVLTDDYNVASPILEATSYYPFGLQQKGIGLTQETNPLHNKYLFNQGTELQEDFDIDLYATDYRSLDPQLGRFWQIDDDAESALDLSPFNYAANNPILFNDPLGLDTTAIVVNFPSNPTQGQVHSYTASDGITWSYTYDSKNGWTPTGSDGDNSIQDVAVTAKAKSSSNNSDGMGKYYGMAAATIAVGLGPEDLPADFTALGEILYGAYEVYGGVKVLQTISATAQPSVTLKAEHGGGKNAAHANQKARNSAEERYKRAKEEYEELRKKPNKTKEDNKELNKLKNRVEHEKQKMDNTGENHSQRAKGSN